EDDEQEQALRVHAWRFSPEKVARVDARSGNRVETARMIRVTATEASRREPRSAQCAVPLDRLAGAVGAARIEAVVGAEHRAQRVLIAADRGEQRRLHPRAASRRCNRRTPSAAAWVTSAAGTAVRTRTITS